MSDPSSTPETLNDLLPITPDGRAERLAELKRLFPDLFTNEGRLNPDELRQLVEPNEVHETERYEFKWYGKAASKREAFTPTTATLVYDEARSVNPDKADGNMIIEGENLETLKLLLNAYREQVKCIYIDPPYNTGKDFIYRDNYKKDKASYWEESGYSESGIALDSNPETSGRYHSNWLSMMHARLLVARTILRPDGFIFVSIDDCEVTNLRRLLDEVFGEENFAADIVWQKTYSPANDKKGVDAMHDHILVYTRSENSEFALLRRTAKQDDAYKNPDNDPRGPWKAVDATRAEHRDYAFYPINTPSGREVWPADGRSWVFNKEEVADLIEKKLLWFGSDGSSKPSKKLFLTEVKQGVTPTTWWPHDEAGHNDTAKKELKALFSEGLPFETPKPTKLLQRIIHLGTNDRTEDLILDFFVGSGSATHAVLLQNAEDGGNRKFIGVQIPEVTPEESQARKVGYKTISAITVERMKRVIEGYGDNPNPIPDAGFKVYKLQKSNFPRCEFKPDSAADEEANVAALRRYIEEKEAAFFLTLDGQGEQAVFDEVLLKNGFQLHYTRSRREDFPDNTVFEVRDPRRTALVCMAWNESIKDSTIKRLREIADAGEAPFFICLERSLSTTSKWNLRHFLGKHFNAF
jgi:adenine-specific DNA-methyltransferase